MPRVPISVSKKILADVSSGIYRTPANALKEVVSNAFDAGAHRVHISTNAPYFDVFTCEDDGQGISATDFKQIMTRIGSSSKRIVGTLNSETKRPIIGKIGIGLLAVAQICHKFSVISKKKGKKNYFHATVDLKQFDEIEQEDSYQLGEGKITLGTYYIEEDLQDEVGAVRHYTKIVMEEIKDGFREKLLEDEKRAKFRVRRKATKSDHFWQFVSSIREKKFNEVAEYDKLIWELGLLCPVEYIEKGPLPNNRIMGKEISRLRGYDFNVLVDGYEIRKPVMFPTSKELCEEPDDYKIYPRITFDKKVNGSRLRFSGYVFHQRKRIQPAELQGILIRIKGVAVGTYDRTFLHYPKAEGPMFNQLSGEIDVEEGLEEALNIDRNSFNEAHRHYLRLQEFLWEYLGGEDGVFKDIRERSRRRQESLRQREAEDALSKMRGVILDVLAVDIKVEAKEEESKEPYVYQKRQRKLVFYSHPFWARNRRQRLVQEKIVMAIVAARESSETVESFEKNLLKVLARGK